MCDRPRLLILGSPQSGVLAGSKANVQCARAAYGLTTGGKISQEAADELQICRFREPQRVSWTEVARSVPAASPQLPRSDSPWFPGRSRKPAQEFPDPKRAGMHRTWHISTRFERDVNAGSLRTHFALAAPALSGGAGNFRLRRGRSPRFPSPHGWRCPRLNRPGATRSAEKAAHLLSNQLRQGALNGR